MHYCVKIHYTMNTTKFKPCLSLFKISLYLINVCYQNKVLESQIIWQANKIDQLKEEIDDLQNSLHCHNVVHQADSSAVSNVIQVSHFIYITNTQLIENHYTSLRSSSISTVQIQAIKMINKR